MDGRNFFWTSLDLLEVFVGEVNCELILVEEGHAYHTIILCTSYNRGFQGLYFHGDVFPHSGSVGSTTKSFHHDGFTSGLAMPCKVGMQNI